MTNVIRFPAQAASCEAPANVMPSCSAGNSDLAEQIAATNQAALTAILATIAAISRALDQIENIRKDLPDGPNKRLLQQQRAALSCALFRGRMMSCSLSSDLAKLGNSISRA